MNREQIIRMAREVGLPHWYETEGIVNEALLIKFAALVASAEREECAALCFDIWNKWLDSPEEDRHKMLYDAEDCADAIRARRSEQESVTRVFDYKEHAEGLQRDYDLLLAEYNDLKAQRTWVGLTDEELEIINDCGDTDSYKFARAIEAKLKEKNNG